MNRKDIKEANRLIEEYDNLKALKEKIDKILNNNEMINNCVSIDFDITSAYLDLNGAKQNDFINNMLKLEVLRKEIILLISKHINDDYDCIKNILNEMGVDLEDD